MPEESPVNFNTKKPWYTSKTIWVNLLSVIGLLVQTQTGFVIDAEAQLGIIAVINLLLRIVTGQPLGK